MTREIPPFQRPVLLAPAGGHESLAAAIHAGADAVYFGVGHLNMRSRSAANFTEDDLPNVVDICHKAGVQAWLTLNIIVYDQELPSVEMLCAAAAKAGVDAIIASDMAVILCARRHGLPVHISVQANVCNSEAVRFFAQFADAMVLARELTIDQVAEICKTIREENIVGPSGRSVQVEVFAHGALCIGISGRCGMSLCGYNSSSSRGSCFQNCRRAYIAKDAETGLEFEIDNQYIMSPKDICTLRQLPDLLKAGCAIFKLEGRGRSADYVAKVTGVYRQAMDMVLDGREPFDNQYDEWMKQLQSVFNRGFWEGGYYLGRENDPWARHGDSQATRKKTFAGLVVNYYPKAKAAEVKITASPIRLKDDFLVTGNATGAVFGNVEELRDANGNPIDCARQGTTATLPCHEKLRVNDKFFVLGKT